MGCHTWFRNKLADMPKEHLEALRKRYIREIKKAYILNCSYEEWLKCHEDDLIDIEKRYTEEEKKTNQLYKIELELIRKTKTREYYEKARKRYLKDLEILNNQTSPKKQLFGAFKKHDLSFELNKDATDGSYSLDNLGWHDNYRVSGYPCVTHHNAKEAIKWLEEYDNGNNIECDYVKGMSCKIREIINKFFNEFPNGTIHYG